jgi:hypothetical protein
MKFGVYGQGKTENTAEIVVGPTPEPIVDLRIY